MDVVTGYQTLVAAIHHIYEFVSNNYSFTLSAATRLNNPVLRWVEIHLNSQVLEILGQHVTLGEEIEVLAPVVLLHPLYSANEIVFSRYFNGSRKLVYLLVFVQLVERWILHYLRAPNQGPISLTIIDGLFLLLDLSASKFEHLVIFVLILG